MQSDTIHSVIVCRVGVIMTYYASFYKSVAYCFIMQLISAVLIKVIQLFEKKMTGVFTLGALYDGYCMIKIPVLRPVHPNPRIFSFGLSEAAVLI